MAPSDKSEEKKEPSSFDLNGMFDISGVLGGVSQILSQFGNLAEKGEALRKWQQENKDQSQTKPAGEFGFSVKFGGADKADHTVEPSRESAAFRKSTRPSPRKSTPSKKEPMALTSREPNVDVYPEEEALLIIAEMPGVPPERVQLEFNDRQLRIEGRSRVAHFVKLIELPMVCSSENVAITSNNGLIEIHISTTEETP